MGDHCVFFRNQPHWVTQFSIINNLFLEGRNDKSCKIRWIFQSKEKFVVSLLFQLSTTISLSGISPLKTILNHDCDDYVNR